MTILDRLIKSTSAKETFDIQQELSKNIKPNKDNSVIFHDFDDYCAAIVLKGWSKFNIDLYENLKLVREQIESNQKREVGSFMTPLELEKVMELIILRGLYETVLMNQMTWIENSSFKKAIEIMKQGMYIVKDQNV